MGHDPRSLAASDDGTYLYVGLQGDEAIERINLLQTNTIERTFPFPPHSSGSYTIYDMHAVPGSPQSVVVGLGPFALFNDAGLANMVSSIFVEGGFTFFNPGTIYTLPIGNFPGKITLDSQGLHFTPPPPGGGRSE